MKKKHSALLSTLFMLAVLFVIYVSMMPQWVSNNEPLSAFSTQKAIEHIKVISQKPHFTGSENHEEVVEYLLQELKKLGLETTIQEGTTLSDWGNLVKSKNILARIKGSANSKALLLLSHYDSAPHSFSNGASDDASGVATILEGLRAFLQNKTPHKNDIIILFSDAEELGLNGAALFVTKNQWAKDIGLAINFEARGSSGPSYMLMEVNHGNAEMVQGFSKAHPKYPVSNSLMYSIYKMLPNDTDLTVFRQQGKIQGFNFAFIDGHYNYHSAQDDYAHISPKTIAHQGSYLMPLLEYFSNADLTTLDSTNDFVYFNTPFYFFSYPFEWVLMMWIAALVLFILLIFIGIGKRVLIMRDITKGFLSFFGTLILSALVAYFGWKILLSAYPQYNDLINGFTYNGHFYIAAFTFLSLAIAFLFYGKSKTESLAINYTVAPILVWLVINLAIVIYLPGAGFFIIPVFFTLLMLAYFVLTQTTNRFVNLILAVPSLVVFAPFIAMFPIGLGLKILYVSAAITVLVFGLLLPVFATFTKKGTWSAGMLICAVVLFTFAHFNSDYQSGKAKPNSLVYILDANTNKASWATYDTNLDEWTKSYLGENPGNADHLNTISLYSKYASKFTFSAEAPLKNLAKPTLTFLRDSVGGAQRYLKIKIASNRKVNRYDISAAEKMIFYNFKANNTKALGQKGAIYQRKGQRVLSYYVVDHEPLVMEFSISKNTPFEMSLLESSFDLTTNPLFQMKLRQNWMMPLPFVLNDAVAISQKIKPTVPAVIPKPVMRPAVLLSKDRLTVAEDSVKPLHEN